MKVFNRSEYEDQVAVFEWAALHEHQWPCLKLLFGSLMGVKLPLKLLNKAKKAGMKKGKPDINLPVPRGGFCGLWIELKALGGQKPKGDQKRILEHLGQVGNAVFACKGSAAAIRTIKAYVKGEIKKNEPNKNREKTRAEPKKTAKGKTLSRN